MDRFELQKNQTSEMSGENGAADPFASDIFASERDIEEDSEAVEAEEVAAIPSPPAWIWRLPKAARSTIDWNRLRESLPADFSDELPTQLAAALAESLGFEAENTVEFLFLIERETNAVISSDDQSWWLNIGIENGAAEFAVEIDDLFAVWLVDTMLGAPPAKAEIRRLTPSETTVLEFLAVNLTHEANKIIGVPLFRFRALTRQPPFWLSGENAAETNAGRLVSNWQTVHGLLNSIVKIHLTAELLGALRADENNLLNRAARRRINWKSAARKVGRLRTRLFFGETRMTFGEFAGLEIGDVVLPENYHFSLTENRLRGSVRLFLGDGDACEIGGAFEEKFDDLNVSASDFQTANDRTLVRRVNPEIIGRVVVESLGEAGNLQITEESMPKQETESTAPAEFNGDGIAAENIQLTLRVELEARRLSLTEIGNLRVNQVIELGARATDAVNLLIDGKIVARGELVEVEERLGVRLTQLF